MRSRRRHRQNAGLSRGLYPLADASPRTDETAHRYLHFQRCLAGRYPYRVSARPVRYFAGRGYHHRTHHSRCPQGQRAFCLRCPPRRESIAGASETNAGEVLCQRKAPTYTEALRDIRGDIICPDCDSRLEWQTKGHRWRCRHCAAFSVQIAPDILLQSIATTMKRLQDNPDSINDQPLSHNTVSIEAEKQQAEIDEMLSAGEFDAASLIQSVLSRADTQYLCCTAGNSDPMTLRIKEALAAAPPCDTFDSKLYHTIADKIVLHRTTSIQLKLINGMVV